MTTATERRTVELQKGIAVDLGSLARAMTAAQLGDLVAMWVNTSGSPAEALQAAAAIEQAHPTLQALSVKFLLNVILSYHPSYTDLRNEAPAHVCNMLRQWATEDISRTYIPLV